MWLQDILSLSEEKGFARDLLMHSRLILENQQLVLYYLESLSCFMTSSIEMKIRKILGSLTYKIETLTIKPGLVKDFPQQLLDRQSDRKRRFCSDLFDRTLIGEHLENQKTHWIEHDFQATET